MCATILQLRMLDPRLLGDFQCDNLEFKNEDSSFQNNLFWNSGILSLASHFLNNMGFKIQDSRIQNNIFLEILNLGVGNTRGTLREY